MAAELLINVTPSETRVALVEDGTLQEVHIERLDKKGIVGNIYKGKISRVLPGMQAAFVDIGLDKAAFLHASDIVVRREGEEETNQKVPDITTLAKQGQFLTVQVIKDPISTKGARLTTDITLPSRYLVFMPGAKHVGVSQRIENAKDRNRLKNVVSKYTHDQGSYIIRTAAEGIGEHELEQDAAFLKRLWAKIIERRQRSKTSALLYEDLSLSLRLLRDFVGTNLERIRVDSKLTFELLNEFTQEFVPELYDKLEYYPGERPIFDCYQVENEIRRALERKVELKSGGYLIIDQTEAMTTIDINTGAFVGHRNLEDTIFSTNLEATKAIARQLRLRNLGGIIIIDFIDMEQEEHRRRVLSSLEAALEKDRVRTNVSKFSSLGLVEMTRKRTRESLEHVLCKECPSCKGRGSLKTTESICYEIFREIIRVDRAHAADRFVVYASEQVCDSLLNEETHHLADLELFIDKEVKIQPEPQYGHEKYDVVMM
ncbi:ribonuclease G [Psychrobium sp. 1_MG-2023]|uniref:ribonuclease G n=1 Tax=Psychrobium sp. 1_MG-2023 TaxID=3062624 RepID=UPI000C33F872|nr:ribonuclease G [Psychrobium sp. 1_MG-2023]MDP2560717.1 ribonuclease G [Psychrobium sp. 1_MG-2023]PKF56747.1 ribonuclease G [Alteromonadales bacterium alter-6D02]